MSHLCLDKFRTEEDNNSLYVTQCHIPILAGFEWKNQKTLSTNIFHHKHFEDEIGKCKILNTEWSQFIKHNSVCSLRLPFRALEETFWSYLLREWLDIFMSTHMGPSQHVWFWIFLLLAEEWFPSRFGFCLFKQRRLLILHGLQILPWTDFINYTSTLFGLSKTKRWCKSCTTQWNNFSLVLYEAVAQKNQRYILVFVILFCQSVRICVCWDFEF